MKINRINPNVKWTVATTVACGALLATATPAFAAVRCETQYGAPYGARQVCITTSDLQINKEVFDPKNKKFVDNLGITKEDHKFAPGEEITFRLKVKNVGDHTFGKVEVHDNLPQFLEKVSGDFAYDLTEFKVGQEDTREIKARVVSVDKLPAELTVICDDRTKNKAIAKSGDQQDRDTAQICVEKKALKELPKAGPTDLLQVLLGSSLLGFAGIKLFGLRTIKRVE